MAKKKDIESEFQIHDWHVFELNLKNTVYSVSDETSTHWKIKATYSGIYKEEYQAYTCVIELSFSASYTSGGETAISGVTGTLFTMKAKAPTIEEEKKAENFARLNGMSFSIFSLRNFLLQESQNLHLEKRLFLPNINLHNFAFDEEYQIDI